jgi:hypothetical protein
MPKQHQLPKGQEITKGEEMPKELQSPEAAAPAAGPADPQPVTRHEQAAARVIAALNAAKAEIMPLESPTAAAIPFNRANGSVDVDFMVGVVGAIENLPKLQGLAVTLDLPAAHDTLDYIQAYVPLLNEIEVFRRAIQFSINSRKAELGAQTLRTYQAMRGLARDKNLGLESHTSILKKMLGRGPKRKSAQAPKPQPQPQPPLETGKEAPKP